MKKKTYVNIIFRIIGAILTMIQKDFIAELLKHANCQEKENKSSTLSQIFIEDAS